MRDVTCIAGQLDDGRLARALFSSAIAMDSAPDAGYLEWAVASLSEIGGRIFLELTMNAPAPMHPREFKNPLAVWWYGTGLEEGRGEGREELITLIAPICTAAELDALWALPDLPTLRRAVQQRLGLPATAPDAEHFPAAEGQRSRPRRWRRDDDTRGPEARLAARAGYLEWAVTSLSETGGRIFTELTMNARATMHPRDLKNPLADWCYGTGLDEGRDEGRVELITLIAPICTAAELDALRALPDLPTLRRAIQQRLGLPATEPDAE